MEKKIKAVSNMYIVFFGEKKKARSSSVLNMRYGQGPGTSVFKMCSQKA